MLTTCQINLQTRDMSIILSAKKEKCQVTPANTRSSNPTQCSAPQWAKTVPIDSLGEDWAIQIGRLCARRDSIGSLESHIIFEQSLVTVSDD